MNCVFRQSLWINSVCEINMYNYTCKLKWQPGWFKTKLGLEQFLLSPLCVLWVPQNIFVNLTVVWRGFAGETPLPRLPPEIPTLHKLWLTGELSARLTPSPPRGLRPVLPFILILTLIFLENSQQTHIEV